MNILSDDFDKNGSIPPSKESHTMNRYPTYDLAFIFKKSKLWQLLREQQIFAVNLPDGRIGYCVVMGANGEHMALSLHIGTEGFSSYRRLNGMDHEPTSYVEMLQQDCIQCSIEKRDQFSSEELADLRSYCKDRGIPFRAPFPQFARYHRYCVPWPVSEDDDWDAIYAALTIVAKIVQAIEKNEFDSLYPRMIYADTEEELYIDSPTDTVTIPLYSIEDDTLKAEQIPLPPYTDGQFTPPTSFNEVGMRKLMMMKKGGTLQCEIIRGPEPVNGEPPYLPALLMTANLDAGLLLTPVMTQGVEYDPNEMVDGFLRSLISAKLYPETILARTEETRTVLGPFCKKGKIRLVQRDDLYELDEAINTIMERMEESEDSPAGDIIEALHQMDIEQIKMLPDFMLEQMLQTGCALPKLIIDKIKEALKN